MKNYKKNYALYKADAFSDFKQLISQFKTKYASKTAFMYVENKEDKSLSYQEHYDNVLALGTAIYDLGYHNAHIAMVGDNSYEWILTQITVLGSDNVLVPIDKELPLNDLLNVINHSDSSVVFCTGSFVSCLKDNLNRIPNVEKIIVYRPKEELDSIFYDASKLISHGKELVFMGDNSYMDSKVDPNSLAEIVYTSGTTGDPKGVMLSKSNLTSCVYRSIETMIVYSKSLSILPYNHTYEATCDLLVSQYVGSTVCINESLKAVANNFKKYKPDYVMLVPLFVETFYKKIIKNVEKEGKAKSLENLMKFSNALLSIGIDLRRVFFKKIRDVFGGNLIMIVCGGAPIRSELAYFFNSIGIALINGYGITECSPLLSVNRIQYNDYKSVGVPLQCISIRFDDVNENGEGEIVVKGDNVMMGYYKNPEATKNVLVDGWFSTGDYGKLINDRLYITGRKKNLIVLKNGKNVFPEEIEDYVGSIEGVEELMVYAPKDENGDETELVCLIYPEKEFAKNKSDEDMITYFKTEAKKCMADLPNYKQISQFVIRHEEFPKTTTKKIKRQEVIKH